MNLIINKMMEFEVVHETDCNSTVKILTCTTITKSNFSVSVDWNTSPLSTICFIFNKILHNIR